jgi:molybdopterin-guanine dinucleotide biosynthesis protein A
LCDTLQGDGVIVIMSSVRSRASTPRVSAAILAGGRALRFGGARKALLVTDPATGERVIDRQLVALAGIADDVTIVSHEPEPYAGLRLPVVPDAIPGAGPLGGLYTALLAAAHPRVIVVACDLPFVTRALFERLVGEAADDVDAVVPRSRGGLEPLCAVYAARIAPALRRRIDADQLQVIAALGGDMRVRELGPEALAAYDRDGRLFVNVNTPHEHARARAWIELDSDPSEDRITE